MRLAHALTAAVLVDSALTFLGGCATSTAPAAESHPHVGAAGLAPHEPRTTRARSPGDLALLEAPARLVAAPGSEAHVSASHEARVVRVHVRAGDRVALGAPIVDVIVPEVLAAAAQLASVTPARALRSARASELAGLQGEGLVDRASVFEQEAELANLDVSRRLALSTLRAASLSTAEASRALREGTVTLRAPIAGVVREVTAVVGETRTAAGAPFATLNAPLPARVEVRFAEGRPQGVSLLFVGVDGTRIPLAEAPLGESRDPMDGAQLVWLEPTEPTEVSAAMRGRVIARPMHTDALEIDAHALVLEGAHTYIERVDAQPRRVRVEVLTASGTRALVRTLEGTPLTVDERISLDPERQLAADED